MKATAQMTKQQVKTELQIIMDFLHGDINYLAVMRKEVLNSLIFSLNNRGKSKSTIDEVALLGFYETLKDFLNELDAFEYQPKLIAPSALTMLRRCFIWDEHVPLSCVQNHRKVLNEIILCFMSNEKDNVSDLEMENQVWFFSQTNELFNDLEKLFEASENLKTSVSQLNQQMVAH